MVNQVDDRVYRIVMQVSFMIKQKHKNRLKSPAVEELEYIYRCAECNIVFLFKSDAEDHCQQTMHENINTIPF